MPRRMKLIVLVLVLTVYVIGYIGTRISKFIVHSVVRDHTDNYLEHSVVAGDGIFLGGMIKNASSVIYTPLRIIETQYWYWHQPIGSPLSSKHLKALPK